jgi:hypothetical protein
MSGHHDPMPSEPSDDLDARFAEVVAGLDLEWDLSQAVESDPPASFTRNGDAILIHLPEALVDTLGSLLDWYGFELVSGRLLSHRLQQPVYEDDPLSELEYLSRREGHRNEDRLDRLNRVLDSLFSSVIPLGEVDVWLKVLNEVRHLACAGVADDVDAEQFLDSLSPKAAAAALCGMIQHELLDLAS